MIIGSATVRDAGGVAEAHVASWRAAYVGPIAQEVLRVLHGDDRASRFHARHGWLAEGAEKIADAGGAIALRGIRHARHLPDGSA